jgi:hypothetical protein
MLKLGAARTVFQIRQNTRLSENKGLQGSAEAARQKPLYAPFEIIGLFRRDFGQFAEKLMISTLRYLGAWVTPL